MRLDKARSSCYSFVYEESGSGDICRPDGYLQPTNNSPFGILGSCLRRVAQGIRVVSKSILKYLQNQWSHVILVWWVCNTVDSVPV